MRRSRRYASVVRFLACATVSAISILPALAEPSLAELFQKGKSEFKAGSYRDSLASFESLDRLVGEPDGAESRAKLQPLIAFYRGANLAAMGERELAVTAFQKYMDAFPAAHIDPSAFPRTVTDAFEIARKRVRAGDKASDRTPMAIDFERFRKTAPPLDLDEKWANGAMRYLMTSEEKEAWKRVSDGSERAELVAKFWERRDPTPESPDNEFRSEIESRIRYADARFAQDEKRGSETDRGMVFVLMGCPSYVAQKPFRTEDDPLQTARNAPTKETRVNSDGTTSTILVPRTALTAQTLQGTREIWYYRRDRLPKEVRFTEVDFEFLTRTGLGANVLQRDHEILTTLDQVARATLPTSR